MKIITPTEVAGVVLQPGDYQVREAKSPEGPVVEFVHEFHNEQASELVQADEEEIVARVKFTEQQLSSPPRHTHLEIASGTNDAIGLQIRGDTFGYAFAAPPMSAQR